MKPSLVYGMSRISIALLIVLVFALGFYSGYMFASSEVVKLEEGNVVVANDRDLYNQLLYWLPRANKSIHIVMYLFKSDTDTIMNLANILVQKSKAGVDVRVIVEKSVSSNKYVYDYLSEAGVKVKYDEGKTTHCKLVIIDSYIVIVGSHNWSYSAMMRNHEASIIIFNKNVASIEEEYFNSLWEKS